MGNPWGDYGDVDLGSIYYGNQGAQSSATGQPVALPDGSNAPAGVDPATGLAIPAPPPVDPNKAAFDAQVNQKVRDWLVSQGRSPNEGVSASDLVNILTQEEIDRAITFGTFGPPGAPLGSNGQGGAGLTQSNVPQAAGATQSGVVPANSPGGQTEQQATQSGAAWEYFANGGTGTFNNLSGAPVGSPQDNAYNQQQLALQQPSANPVEGQRVLSTDPNAIYTQNQVLNPDGTRSFQGYTFAAPNPTQSTTAGLQIGGGVGGGTKTWNEGLVNNGMGAGTKVDDTRAYQIANFQNPQPAPATNAGVGGNTPKPAIPYAPKTTGPRTIGIPRTPAQGASQSASWAKPSQGQQSRPSTPRVRMPRQPGRPATETAAKDWLQDIQDRFEDVEIRIRRPRDGASIQPMPEE